jgi:gas vesicle protein
MNSGKVALGIVVGVAIGATLGILFAPAKGIET